MSEPFLFGRVQRVDFQPPGSIVVEVFAAPFGKAYLLFESLRGELLLHRQKPPTDVADSFTLRLRKLLIGTTAHAETHDSALVLCFERAEQRYELQSEERELVLRTGLGAPAAARRRVTQRATRPPTPFVPLQWSNVEPTRGTAAPAVDPRVRDLTRARKRILRRISAISSDLERAEAAAVLRVDGELLLAYAHQYCDGDLSLEVLDYYAVPPANRKVELPDGLRPGLRAAQLFDKAKRLERGQRIAATRLADASAELAHYDQVLSELRAQQPSAGKAADALLSARPDGTRNLGQRSEERLPYRVFLSGEHPIRVGRNASDNDRLTLSAKPHDLWVHARGIPGSHVIVPLTRHLACPEQVLLDAAHLAAHFSSDRNATSIEIQYTERKFVRKPKGAAPGVVLPQREKTLHLHIDSERLRLLLASER